MLKQFKLKTRKLANVCALSLGAAMAMTPGMASALDIMVAYGNQPGEPIDKALHLWAEKVEERSNGEIELKLFPSSQLGAETEVMEQAKMGAPIITISSYGSLMDIVPDLGVINAPYLTQSFDDKSKLLNSDWFKGKSEELSKKGLQIVVPDVVYGTRHLMSKFPVKTTEDLKGKKVRVQQSRLFIATIKTMGGVPTPMSLADVYPGLAQGVVDGLENPSVVLLGGKFHEVAKELNLTGHTKHMSPFVAGSAFWETLSEEQKTILIETSRDMVKHGAELVMASEEAAIEELKANGVKVNEVDIAAFEESARKMVQAEFPEWTPNLYTDTQKLMQSL
ncbi:C4-dicarboxylate TRAP transporter substrate-binding protein [Parendozoicomonas haliclonae]|uniref:Sialic acid-binding periplasmic protein SiaP n=1 Tax=Parendozoicomonas haliclonae TaxID=1960125 RepID=A0A1X7AGP4_9GAMM|nr:C4-dicarboxylate TRAP transporter substrate-binding protein [Parendozoicomonas haliclonae]SMA39577.1 Sialic acid-binding periplasmic protein SiaP precursor [Parendozoicomonas haliclonae]